MKFLDLVAKDKKEVNIIMFGSVSQWSSLNATKMQEALQQAEKDGYERVNLLINSPGGSIFEGLAIYNTIKSFTNLEIVGDVMGMAASMASAFIMACDKVRIGKGARLMIHSGRSGVYGSASQILQHGKLLESLNETIAEIYAGKVDKDTSWILENWMKDGVDTWFDAKQAEKAGLVDEVYGSKVKSGEAHFDFDKMAAHYEGEVEKIDLDGYDQQVSNSITDKMKFNFFEKFPKLAALIENEDEITAEVISAVNEELSGKGIQGVTVVSASAQEALEQQAKTDANLVKAQKASLEAVMKELNAEHSGEVTQEAIVKAISDLQKSKSDAEARVVELGGEAGDKHTNSQKPGGDSLDGQDDPSGEIAKLPHNAALDNNPLFN